MAIAELFQQGDSTILEPAPSWNLQHSNDHESASKRFAAPSCQLPLAASALRSLPPYNHGVSRLRARMYQKLLIKVVRCGLNAPLSA